jgi:chemotaxis protein histidine kinase CheA
MAIHKLTGFSGQAEILGQLHEFKFEAGILQIGMLTVQDVRNILSVLHTGNLASAAPTFGSIMDELVNTGAPGPTTTNRQAPLAQASEQAPRAAAPEAASEGAPATKRARKSKEAAEEAAEAKVDAPATASAAADDAANAKLEAERAQKAADDEKLAKEKAAAAKAKAARDAEEEEERAAEAAEAKAKADRKAAREKREAEEAAEAAATKPAPKTEAKPESKPKSSGGGKHLLDLGNIPKAISEAKSMRAVVLWFTGQDGLTGSDEEKIDRITAECERAKEVVPYFAKVPDLRGRIAGCLEMVL